MIAIDLARWLSPEFAVSVSVLVYRHSSGDMSLVPEVVARHDTINNTTSRVLVSTVSNDIIEAERRAAAIKEENEQLERQVRLDMLSCDVLLKEIEAKSKDVEVRAKDVEVKEKELALVKHEAVQKMQLEDAVLERKRRQVQFLNESREDVHLYVALKDELVGPASERLRDLPIMPNLDLTTLAAQVGFTGVTNDAWRAVGPIISKEYRMRYGGPPQKTRKLCNGANHFVNVYTERDYDWIKTILRRELPKHKR